MGASQVTFSIVSHGHGKHVAALLADLAREIDVPAEYILTLNVPEDERALGLESIESLTIVRNAAPRGFGANHNAAFLRATSPVFAIVNPDIRLEDFHLPRLLSGLRETNVGLCGPLVRNSAGCLEDSARYFPSLFRIFRRTVLGRRDPDYPVDGQNRAVDWMAGMFLLFRSAAYAEVDGFDERYFMYLEDADICRRLWRQGWQVLQVQDATVIHDAQRASHRDLRHLSWHLRSLARFILLSNSASVRKRAHNGVANRA
jgi:N-acetylglucosaminyl-diphospho-decaprenol L-rhamnosyltransferase